MKNVKALGLATLTVILNGLIGHFFAPNGITLIPVVLIITTSLVCFGTQNIKIIFISILTFLFIAMNDISIKLFAGGSHDNEGLAWVHLLLFVGLVPAFGLLLTRAIRGKDEKFTNRIIAVLLFIGLIVVHLQLFSDLGLGRHY